MMIKKTLRNSVLNVLGSFGQPSNGVHILNGHRISLGKPRQRILFQKMRKLSYDVDFVRFEKAVELICTFTQVDRPIVAFSFDDGFEECYTHIAPVLEDYGINAAFFINPNFVTGDTQYIKDFTKNIVLTPNKRPMSWEQIIELQERGHIIGSHTMDHYCINDDDVQELEYQIGNSKLEIEKYISGECQYFAFPFGRLEHANQQAIEIALKHYKYVFSQSNYKNYFSFDGKVINRRHFEPDWKTSHVKYFLSHHKIWPKY